MPPTRFVHEIPWQNKRRPTGKAARDKLRTGLRDDFDAKLVELTGNPLAHMAWEPKTYGTRLVLDYGFVLEGWPDGLPFRNLSHVPGGNKSLLRLRELWDRSELRFKPASTDDLNKASRDPLSVLPDGGLCLQVAKNIPERVAILPPAPLVMHPIDLRSLGVHHPEPAAHRYSRGDRTRQQRSDIKKPRARPVTNPHNLPLRRPKRGVVSRQCVLDLDDEDGEVREASSAGSAGTNERPTKRRRYTLVDDPIHEFVLEAGTPLLDEVEAIQSDMESWLGSQGAYTEPELETESTG
ncbi:hypothetical protein C8Q73DRAFT_794410 [Cubamyces lactineus]|nr:hypothetical protein C8Q73DRAFT_794410 [Cubamyces lactineus]